MTPLEASHDHHLPARATSARSSRTLFRPQASGDGTRMQGVLGESRASSCHLSINSRAGSNSGSQQQQYAGRRQLLTMAHTSTASSAPMPYREFLAEGRASVGLYATALVCAHSSLTGVPWTSCRSRVYRYVMSTAVVGRVALDYCCIIVRLHMNPTTCQVIT